MHEKTRQLNAHNILIVSPPRFRALGIFCPSLLRNAQVTEVRMYAQNIALLAARGYAMVRGFAVTPRNCNGHCVYEAAVIVPSRILSQPCSTLNPFEQLCTNRACESLGNL